MKICNYIKKTTSDLKQQRKTLCICSKKNIFENGLLKWKIPCFRVMEVEFKCAWVIINGPGKKILLSKGRSRLKCPVKCAVLHTALHNGVKTCGNRPFLRNLPHSPSAIIYFCLTPLPDLFPWLSSELLMRRGLQPFVEIGCFSFLRMSSSYLIYRVDQGNISLQK